MQKSRTIKDPQIKAGRPSDIDQLINVIKKKSRLSAKDKREFAMNLGKLAARVDPDKPLRGAQQIIKQSKQIGIEEKRKRYFRFPSEDAPDSDKGGEYASNPTTFIALAEAAGELLSNSSNQKIIDKYRENAVKSLVQGSSFMPKYEPLNTSDMGAKQVLEEYASTLATAITQRTKILDLWRIIEDTPIQIIDADEYEELHEADEELHKTEYFSPYGDAAVVSPELLNVDWAIPQKIYFAPGSDLSIVDDWMIPKIQLGHIAGRVRLQALSIPEEMLDTFDKLANSTGLISTGLINDAENANKISLWLNEVGYHNTRWPKPNDQYLLQKYGSDDSHELEEESAWEEVWATLFHSVSLEAKKGDNNQITMVLNCRRPSGFLLDEDYSDLVAKEKEYIKNHNLRQGYPIYLAPVHEDGTVYQRDEEEYDDQDWFSVRVFHSDLFNSNRSNSVEPLPPAFAIIEVDHWEILTEEYKTKIDVLGSEGWTENKLIAELLLGSSDLEFYHSGPQIDLTGQILRSNSLGARLWNNVNDASNENSITDLLINRAALIADSGLQFYEAMLEEHRKVLKKI